MSELERILVDLSHNLTKDVSPQKAVFTVSQTEEIIRLDIALNKLALSEIEKLKCIKRDESLAHKLCEIESEVNKLIEYDEHNSEIVSSLKREMKHVDQELTSLDKKIHELSEKTAEAMISQDRELQEVECTVKKLALREYKDERIEDIIRRLALAESREMKDCRVDRILDLLKLFETKESIQQLVKRIALCEAKEYRDERIETILHEICELKKVNKEQNQHIVDLTNQNTHQSQEIKSLSDKLNRNSLALDTKIDNVERLETLETKVNLDQNASIKLLQSEIFRLKQEMDNIQKVILVRP